MCNIKFMFYIFDDAINYLKNNFFENDNIPISIIGIGSYRVILLIVYNKMMIVPFLL